MQELDMIELGKPEQFGCPRINANENTAVILKSRQADRVRPLLVALDI